MSVIDKILAKKQLISKAMNKKSQQDGRYEEVVFIQNQDEAEEPLRILDEQGRDAALEYLKQWHYPGEHMRTDTIGAGSSDDVYEKDGYIMVWNNQLGYIGLEYDTEYDEKNDLMKHTNAS